MVASQLSEAVVNPESQLRSSGTYLRRVDPTSLVLGRGPFPYAEEEARYITSWNIIKFFLDWVVALAGVVFLMLSFVGHRLAEVSDADADTESICVCEREIRDGQDRETERQREVEIQREGEKRSASFGTPSFSFFARLPLLSRLIH